MPHTLYKDTTQELSFELWFRNRDKSETKPTVSSGTIQIIDPSGNFIVPLTNLTITGGNKGTFLARPTSGTATTGTFQEIWDMFVNNGSNIESFQHINYLYIIPRE